MLEVEKSVTIDIDKLARKLPKYMGKDLHEIVIAVLDSISFYDRNESETSCAKTESTPTVNPSKNESSGVIHHRKICEELNQLYKAKNTDYGDSCHQTYIEEGMATFRVRLSDKLNRFKILTSRKSSQKVNDESVRDTLMDLINYSIMAIMEIDNGRIE